MEILACPMCRYEDLKLIVLEEKDEIESGVIHCSNCSRYYPIIDTIPVMLPDELRNRKEDTSFLEKWRDSLPEEIVYEGKPTSLKEKGIPDERARER